MCNTFFSSPFTRVRLSSHRIPYSKMSGVSTIDMVVVGTFLLIGVCVVGCMFLLNCLYYKQRHGHQSTILAHTLGSRKPCGYNRSSKHTNTLKTEQMKNSEWMQWKFLFFFLFSNHLFFHPDIFAFHFYETILSSFFVAIQCLHIFVLVCVFGFEEKTKSKIFVFLLSLQHRL